MKYQSLFSQKNKKKYQQFFIVELAQRVVMVKCIQMQIRKVNQDDADWLKIYLINKSLDLTGLDISVWSI